MTTTTTSTRDHAIAHRARQSGKKRARDHSIASTHGTTAMTTTAATATCDANDSPSLSSDFDLFEHVFRDFEAAQGEGLVDAGDAEHESAMRLTDETDAAFEAVMSTIERDMKWNEMPREEGANAVRVKDVKVKCSSCKHTLLKDVDFAPGKKTCTSCLEKHRNYEQRKRNKKLEQESGGLKFSKVWNGLQSGNSYARAATVVARSRRGAAIADADAD